MFLVLSWEEYVYYSLFSARLEHFCALGSRARYFPGNTEFCRVWKKKEGFYSAILSGPIARALNSLSGWPYKQGLRNLVCIVEERNSQLWNGSRARSLEAGVCLVLGVLSHSRGKIKLSDFPRICLFINIVLVSFFASWLSVSWGHCESLDLSRPSLVFCSGLHQFLWT